MSAEALARIGAAREALAEYDGSQPNDYERAYAQPLADALRALIPEPPTDDEREAIVRILDDGANWQYTGTHTTFIPERGADAVLASPEWRNRHRGPITREGDLRAKVLAYAEDRARHSRHPVLNTVGSGRIASDLFAILGIEWPEDDSSITGDES